MPADIGRLKLASVALQGLLPSRARLILTGSNWQEVPAEAVSPGDLLAVLPGDKVPVDGRVVSGCTTIDESALTGEAMPVGKSEGTHLSGASLTFQRMLVMTCCDQHLHVQLSIDGDHLRMVQGHPMD